MTRIIKKNALLSVVCKQIAQPEAALQLTKKPINIGITDWHNAKKRKEDSTGMINPYWVNFHSRNKNRCEKSLIKRNKIFKCNCTSAFSNDTAYAFSHHNIQSKHFNQISHQKLWIKQHFKRYSTFYHAQYLSLSLIYMMLIQCLKKIFCKVFFLATSI